MDMATLNGSARAKVHLTQKEQELLHLLESNPGRCFSRPYLLKTIWGYADETKTRTVDVHISRLRKKLRGHRDVSIHSIVRQGYVLQPNGASQFGSSMNLPTNEEFAQAAHA